MIISIYSGNAAILSVLVLKNPLVCMDCLISDRSLPITGANLNITAKIMIALSGICIYRNAVIVLSPPSLLITADRNSPITKNLGMILIKSPVTAFGNARYAKSRTAYMAPYPMEDLYLRSYIIDDHSCRKHPCYERHICECTCRTAKQCHYKFDTRIKAVLWIRRYVWICRGL